MGGAWWCVFAVKLNTRVINVLSSHVKEPFVEGAHFLLC